MDIGNRTNNKIPWVDKQRFINSNCTKNGSFSNYHNMSDVMDKEIPFMKEIQPNHYNPNYSKSKYHDNNTVNNNCNIKNILSNKELWLDNFKNPRLLDIYGS